MPELPPLPETGIPIDLVRRRPDVQSAFKRLQAADQEVAAAISNKYPRLNLSISTAIRSNDVNDIFQTWARSFAGNLVVPIFYGGRLNAEVDRTEAVKQQLLYDLWTNGADGFSGSGGCADQGAKAEEKDRDFGRTTRTG
ncbi:MAG: TolC family protein [Owenweeksia sp.]|nr:TolC family protein [Owenweeksia sp.]